VICRHHHAMGTLSSDEHKLQSCFLRSRVEGKKTSMKKRIIILGAIVLLVAAAWTGTWYFFAGQLRQQIELLAFADGESSPQLVCETLDVSGYPFRFDVDCANAALVSGDLLVEIPG